MILIIRIRELFLKGFDKCFITLAGLVFIGYLSIAIWLAPWVALVIALLVSVTVLVGYFIERGNDETV